MINGLKKVLKKTFIYSIVNELKYINECSKNKELYNRFKKLNILDDYKTVDTIVEKGLSFARFGDGEFRWMLNDPLTPSFQDNNPELAERLRKVIFAHDERLLIGISKNMQDVRNLTSYEKFFWRMIVNQFGDKIIDFLSPDIVYGNASLTRFYMGYKNKKNTKKLVENLRRIWNGKDILFIEGQYSRLGVGNDLFCNCKSIRRIIGPSKNAFSKCDEIIRYVDENINKDVLIILALGPTATVMAYDLCKLGYQAIDLGHADIEYEWYLNGTKKKINIKGKTANEVENKEQADLTLVDDLYEKSIIEKFL